MYKKNALKHIIFKTSKWLELDVYKPFVKKFKTKKLYEKSLRNYEDSFINCKAKQKRTRCPQPSVYVLFREKNPPTYLIVCDGFSVLFKI